VFFGAGLKNSPYVALPENHLCKLASSCNGKKRIRQ